MEPTKKDTAEEPNQNKDKSNEAKGPVKDDKQGKEQKKETKPRNPNEFNIHYILSPEEVRKDKYEKELKMFEKKQEMAQKMEEEMRKKMMERKEENNMFGGLGLGLGINFNLSMLDKNESPKIKIIWRTFCSSEQIKMQIRDRRTRNGLM